VTEADYRRRIDRVELITDLLIPIRID
jgi:hypothetical protein